MRTVRLAAALLLVAAAIAAIGALLMPNPTADSTASRPAARTVHAAVNPDSAFLTALDPGADLPPARAAALTEAGQLVCEGFTADVPVSVMTRTLMDRYALTGEEAMRLVNTAGVILCYPTT